MSCLKITKMIKSWQTSLILFNNLTKESAVDCFQIRSLSDERFLRKIGKINPDNLDEIKDALSKVLSIEDY